jgi:hypothetical protein
MGGYLLEPPRLPWRQENAIAFPCVVVKLRRRGPTNGI